MESSTQTETLESGGGKMHVAESQFLGQVFPAELNEIKARRAQLKLDTSALGGPPSARQGLVGLALSGGGIRSATFCLGAIQALGKSGSLKFFDYLSTVSGGGFVGSCLSSVMQGDAGAGLENTSLADRQLGTPEPPVIRHLRNSSKYLAPGGMLDTLRLPALILRGIVTNFLLLLPYVMLLVLLTEAIYQSAERGNTFYRKIPFISPAILLGMIVIFPFLSKVCWSRMVWEKRDRFERAMGLFFLFTLVSLLLGPIMIVIGQAIDISWEEILYRLRRDFKGSFELRHIWAWLAALVVLQLVMRVATASRFLSKWRGKIALCMFGLLGPLSLFVLYLLLCAYQIDSPFLGETIPVAETIAWKRDVELLGTNTLHEDLRVALNLPKSMEVKQGHTKLEWLLRNPASGERYRLQEKGKILDLYHDFATELNEGKITPALRHEFERKGGITPNAHIVESNPDHADDYNEWRIDDHHHQFWIWSDNGRLRTDKPLGWGDRRDWLFLTTALVLLVANLLFVNINLTSAHGFYRDRLSRAYLVTQKNGEVVFNDGQLLSQLGTGPVKGPFHLINAALNLRDSPEAIIRGRHSDFFSFSKLFCGSQITGFCPTTALEQADPHLNLGTAMAISGAAASPNAGVSTVGPLVFILTVLNVRLGYWLPNPAVVCRAGAFRRWVLGLGPPPRHLLKEAFGILHASGDFINVSDGGHIENLGVYELLRRRCKVIIAVDSEADAEMRFGGLLRLLTYARVDMGIDIEIDLSSVRRGGDTWNQGHFTIGRIHYGEDELDKGLFVYIKSTMTGDEDEGLRDYKLSCPSFPHEPTTDQFFSESQFECYRRLGFHAAQHALANAPQIPEAIMKAVLGSAAPETHKRLGTSLPQPNALSPSNMT